MVRQGSLVCLLFPAFQGENMRKRKSKSLVFSPSQQHVGSKTAKFFSFTRWSRLVRSVETTACEGTKQNIFWQVLDAK